MAGKRPLTKRLKTLDKCPTGIQGLDEITEGGFPRGRTTLICGGAGCGKTLLAAEFIVRGITEFNEPGVFMAFEESAEDLAVNVASLGFDIEGLIKRRKMAIDFVRIERSEIEETGEYDLEGLFIRLEAMIKAVRAKRVALDTIEALFAGIPNEAILRAELRRLFRWLKEKGVTAVVTGEQGEKTLTRHGLEEYVSDCVILLDHRVRSQTATRRLRIIKYRGSKHGTNEYPTLIGERGLSILPISSLGLDYPVSSSWVSTGLPRLDAMMGGKGYYRGSSVLISGTAGSGKTSLAAAFADATCRRGGRCMYFSFEESPHQIVRNMESIGFDLSKWVRSGRLRVHSVRPSLYGLEMHLASVHELIQDFRPVAIVMDPITGMTTVGEWYEVKGMLTQVIDYLKKEGITTIFTSLTSGGASLEESAVGISSLMDTWIIVQMLESENERTRIVYILKSRGMAHSNQMREFILTDKGIELRDVYVGPGAVLTGSARVIQEAKDESEATVAQRVAEGRQRELAQERASLVSQIEALRTKLEAVRSELEVSKTNEKERRAFSRDERARLSAVRKTD